MGILRGTTILVVGGTGFIGHHFVRLAKTEGLEVTSLSLSRPGTERTVEDVEYIVSDVECQNSLREKIGDRSFNYVVNFSGYIDHTPIEQGGDKVIRQHFLGLSNLITVINKGNLIKFIQVGSSDEYGGIPGPQKETDFPAPATPYAVAKLAATQFAQMLYRANRMPMMVFRIFLVYGPGQSPQRFIPQLVRGCINNIEFPVSEGKQIRDFCYVGDAISAIFWALDKSQCEGEVINLASGIPIRTKDVVSIVQSLTGGGVPIVGGLPYRNLESMVLYADISKAKQFLNWMPLTSLEEGLQKTIEAEKLQIA